MKLDRFFWKMTWFCNEKCLIQLLIYQVKNHGISEKILNNVMGTAREFFHLPEEEKMKLHSPGDFTSPIRFAPSIKDDDQNIVVSRESLKFLSDPLENYVNLWPTNPSSFR